MDSNHSNSPEQGSISRRDFLATGTAVGALLADAAVAADTAGTPAAQAPLDLAEWSFFWVGVERVELARGAVVNGKQMYVEYQIPAQVKHPYPIVLVHGGGGQGLDWMGTPDGRPGWTTYLLQEGYKVYVVDRPGHGRSPFNPDLHGPFPQRNITLEQISGHVHAAESQPAQRARQCEAAQSVAGHGGGGFAGVVAVGGLAGRLVPARHPGYSYRLARARRHAVG